MKAKELLIISLVGVFILIGAVQTTAESPSNEQLNKFYDNYLSDKINKTQSKTVLKSSRSENLRLVGAMAEKKVIFLAENKDELVEDMIKQDIGKRPYKIEYFLNKRFSEYHDCLVLAESGAIPRFVDDTLYACK